MVQLALFNDATPGINCVRCGARLRDLSEMRGRCPEAEGEACHEVSSGDYFALYRNTPAELAAGARG